MGDLRHHVMRGALRGAARPSGYEVVWVMGPYVHGGPIPRANYAKMGAMDTYGTQLHGLATGHGLLALCAVLYLAWWFEFFRPRGVRPQGLEYRIGVALIIVAAVAGILGVVRICTALADMPTLVPAVVLWPSAAAAYIVLAVVTYRALGRPITTELLLIVAWTALELSVVGALLALGSGFALHLLVLAALGFIGSMVCYVLYYRLAGWPAFLDGCGPLVAVGVIAAVTALVL